MIQSYGNSHSNYCKYGKFSLMAISLGSSWKLSQIVHLVVLLYPGDGPAPLLLCMDPRWIPLGECTPLLLENCTLVIPPSESVEMCLKKISLSYCEMGRKGFPECDLMIAREPRMCRPQVSHSQCPENASQMILLS
jgi:hypothetical protein